MIELIKKFCHHNRDVRPPSPSTPSSSLDNDFDEFHHTFDANYYKNPPPQSGFDCPDCGGKNPDLAGRPGSGGGDCFHGSKKL